MAIRVKKIFLVIVFSLFLLSFASAIGTQTQTTFIIGGCSTTYDGQTITAPKDSCYINQESEADGRFFCTADGYFVDTMLPSNGCSLNRNVLPDPANLVCCPKDYYCDDPSGSFQCIQRTEECSSFVDENDCEDKQCVWVEKLGQCVATLDDLSCGFYETKKECEDDNLSLSKVGIGSNIIGSSVECGDTVYSISEEDSSCIWDTSGPEDICSLNYVAEEALSGSGSFQCSKSYTLGECIDGEQAVDWNSDGGQVLSGGLTDVPADCLAVLGCASGSETRYCGEETIKLPGFSLFSLLASISIISVWYFAKSARFK